MNLTFNDDTKKGLITKIAGLGLTILLKSLHFPDAVAEKTGDGFSDILNGIEPQKEKDDFKKRWFDALDRMWNRMEKEFNLNREFWDPLEEQLFRRPEDLKMLFEADNPSETLIAEIKNYYSESSSIDTDTLPVDLIDKLLFFLDEEIKSDLPLLNRFNSIHMHMSMYGMNRKVEQLDDKVNRYITMDKSGTTMEDRSQTLINAFYKDVVNRMTSINYESGDLFGYEPLNDVYITPYIMIKEKKISILDHIEKTFSGTSDTKAIIIYGEPGQGKTSLCWKAVYEFKVNRWLNSRFKNVFRFSLNASNFNIRDDLSLYDYNILDTYLKIEGHSISSEYCKDSLVFLDGFDELYDNVISKPLNNFSMEYFLRNVLFNSFSECAGCCFVITSRRMCIEHELRNNKIAGINAYGICKMDDADQDMWMDLYGNLLQKNLPNHYYNISNLDDYWDYIAKLRKIREDNNIKGLLEIPILFRMIIHCRFLPITKDVNYNQVSIYESLFHETIMRHDGDETSIKNAMEHLAYAIYMDNDDSADLDDVTVGISSSHNKKHIKTSDSLKNVSIPSWIYSYYTMYSGGKKRVMFLHRSFYQYFFACYIYRFIRDINETTLSKTDLSFWGRRRISHDVFDYLNQLLDDNDKVALRNNGNAIVKILTDTDSILLSDNNHSVNNNVSIIDQAGNAFCNLVSSLSVLNALPKDAFNTTLYVSDQKYYRKPLLNCLKRYSSHGIIIKNVDVSQEIANSSPSFRDAIIINVDFNDSDYKGSVFNGAIINNDNFQKTDLRGASFMNTSINNTDFSDADLRGASFSYMAFNNCDMIGTNFRGAEFSSVTFSYNCNIHGADFRGASFINVSFEDLDLDGVDFRGTFFSYCNMADTIIKNTSFEGAILKDTALPKGFENNQE